MPGANPEVIEEVQKELRRIGDDAKARMDSLQKEFADFKAKHQELIEKGATKAEIEELIDKQGTAVVEKTIAPLNERLDKAETMLSRTALPSGETGEKRLKDAIEFKRTVLSLQGKNVEEVEAAEMGVEDLERYEAAFRMFVRRGMEKKDLTVGSDPDGGYLVTPFVSNQVITKIWESSPIRQLASVESITTDSFEELVDVDETDAGWVGETQARTGNTGTPEIAKLSIPVHEMYAIPKATQKLLEDAGINVESWLAQKIAAKFARTEATAFILGTGVGQPKGITQYADGTDWKTVEQVKTGAAAGVLYANVITLLTSLKETYHNNATWLMNRAGLAKMLVVADGDSSYIFKPEFKAAGIPATIAGYPIRLAADLDDPADTKKSYYFGDFRQGYKVIDRLGVSILRDPYSAKPYVQFYSRRRVGGSLLNGEAIKAFVCGT